MAKDSPQQPEGGADEAWKAAQPALPAPTQRFRHHSWVVFQRALDPLAPPKPLPPKAASPSDPPPRADG